MVTISLVRFAQTVYQRYQVILVKGAMAYTDFDRGNDEKKILKQRL